MLDNRGGIVALDVGEGVSTAFRAYKKTVALGIIPGANRSGIHSHKTPVAILTMPGRDSFADDPAFGSPSDVNHLGSGVSLLVVVGDSHGIEFGR